MEQTSIRITKEANRKLALWQIQNDIKSRSEAILALLRKVENDLSNS